MDVELFDAVSTLAAMFTIVVLPIVLGGAIGVVIAETLQRKRIRIYSRVKTRLSATECLGPLHQVGYASETRFQKSWKVSTYEACGLLSVRGEQIVFSGELFSGSNLNLVFDKGLSTVELIGMKFWSNGGNYWMRISDDKGNHYFTSDPGLFVFGSARKCRYMYRSILGSLQGGGKAAAYSAVSSVEETTNTATFSLRHIAFGAALGVIVVPMLVLSLSFFYSSVLIDWSLDHLGTLLTSLACAGAVIGALIGCQYRQR